MSRRWACALLILCADVLIAAGHAAHFTGGSLLLILAVDALLAFGLLGAPSLRAAYRHQADIIARTAPRGEDLLVIQRREQFVRDMQKIRDNNVFLTVASVRGES